MPARRWLVSLPGAMVMRMSDAMDGCQAFNDDHVADALKRHAERPRPIGLTSCEVADCREPIAPERTRLGARLCEECQQDEDLRARHFARGRMR